MPCNICLKSISAKSVKVSCGKCGNDFHGSCVKLTKDDVESICQSSSGWDCDPCQKETRAKMPLESRSHSGNITLEDIKSLLDSYNERHLAAIKDLSHSLEYYHNKVLERKSVVASQASLIDEQKKTIDSLVAGNKDLFDSKNALMRKLDECDQYARRNCVEIHGVPESPNENVMNVVQEIGQGLNRPISEDMVDACHRLHSPGGRIGPRPIIVKFVRRSDKEALIKSRATKRNFSTRHMGRTDDFPIWIRESLTATRRRLFKAARDFAAKEKFKFAWTKNGKIFLRKNESSKFIYVENEEALKNV